MLKYNINYKWEKIGIWKLREIKKSEWVKASELKRDYWFTTKQIKEFEESWKLNFTIYWKTKYYSKNDLLKLL